MISVELWRARIGLFDCTVSCSSLSASINRSPSTVPVAPRRGIRRKKSFRICIPSDPDQLQESEPSESTILRTSPLTSSSLSSAPSCIDSTCLVLLLNIVASSLLIIAVICQLLMTSGDIETNPGPIPGADSKPQLADLQHMTYTTEDGRKVQLRLMDQLKVRVVRVAIALRFPLHAITAVECHDDPVYYLLREWLRGANSESDPRPVTWRTLIDALRDSNCLEEADILEKYLIEPTSCDTTISGGPLTASENIASDRFFYNVPVHYRGDFVNLQDKFGDMFDDLQKNVKSVPVDDLKQYCSRFRELDVQDAGTTNDVMKIVRNECTLVDCSYLQRIADHFNLQEANKSIMHYHSILDDFCKHTLEEHSYAKSFRVDHPEPIVPSSNKIVITFQVEWKANKKSLKDIRSVLRKAFGSRTDRVKIVVIKDGSVVVLCWAPRYLMTELVRLAKSKLDWLKKNGVVKLTVDKFELITEKVDTVGSTQSSQIDLVSLRGSRQTTSMRLNTTSLRTVSLRRQLEYTDLRQTTMMQTTTSLRTMSLRRQSGFTNIGDELLKRLQEEERVALQLIKEDLAIWLSVLLDNQITANTFMNDLKSAVPLCKLAKLIQQAAAKMSPMAPRVSQKEIYFDLPVANTAINMFRFMNNAANFISWCKNVEGVHTFFESEGLVKQKDERGVVLCILDLARVAAEVGMESPELVKMERDILMYEADKEKAAEKQKSDASSYEEVAEEQSYGIDMNETDEKKTTEEQKSDASSHALDDKDMRTLQLFNQCTCQPKLKVVSYGGGKFQITINRKIITLYTRALRDRVMVRTGGGWNTLDHFLLKHDPCRYKLKDH